MGDGLDGKHRLLANHIVGFGQVDEWPFGVGFIQVDGTFDDEFGINSAGIMITETTISVIANAIRSSGLIFTPSVSSSKNLRSPALAAGIGLLLSFFLLIRPTL
jgi:hypothetical protein